MSDTLTQLITKVQAILGDNGTIFTTATCTAAIRQALSDWNRLVPIHAAELITGVSNQYEYELSDFDVTSVRIIDVLKRGTNANELDVSLDYDDYVEDERLFFRLRQPVTSSDTLIVRYTKDHTINGLDSATESTLLSRDDQAMVNGGAFYAIMTRAITRVESINLSQEQTMNYQKMAGMFAVGFGARVSAAIKNRRAPVSEPDTRSWNDSYHSWDQ